MNKVFTSSLLIFLLGNFWMAVKAADKPVVLRESIMSGEYNRTYALYRPTGWDKLKNMPLLIALHGAGGDADQMEQLSGFVAISEREKFVLVYPEGIDHQWNDGRGRNELVNDVGFIKKLINFLTSEFNIDTNKVYVTGMSNGGFMTMRLACELPEKIAAVASVASTVDSALDAHCQTLKPMPVMVISGDKDKLVPLNGGIVPHLPHSKLLSQRALLDKWALRDSCIKTPQIMELPDLKPDGTKVTQTIYSQGKHNTEVIGYLITNGGHTWPGGYQYLPATLIGKTTHELNASEAIWDFFKRH